MPEEAATRSQIRPVKERVEDELLAIPGVNAVDINEKISDGKPTGELSIVVYVDEKKPKSRLKQGEQIPPKIDGIPTDVQEEKIVLQIGAHQALFDIVPEIDTTRYPELHGGISMGPCRSFYREPPEVAAPGNYVFVGTLGAIVKDRVSGAKMALTNFHVACVDTTWSAGDTMAQPSLVDGGHCPADRFGTLTRAVLSEHVDGAVVSIDSSKTTSCTIEGIGDVKGSAAAVVGSAVRKRGRTTELTHGTVNSTDVAISLDYGDGLGTRTLRNQIRVAPDTSHNPRFSNSGDSGSVVVDANNKVIGLLFAGALNGSATYLNPIQFALDELNVDLCVASPFTPILTKPVVCEVVKTKPVFCVVTRATQLCHIVTRPVICNITTSPVICNIIKTSVSCPPVTLACPVRTLACGPGQIPIDRPPLDNPIHRSDYAATYGAPSIEETAEDAYWLGYFAALEAMSEAEKGEDQG